MTICVREKQIVSAEKPSARITAQLKLFERLLISYQDFNHASRIASYILEHKLEDKVGRLRGKRRYRIRLLWEALNSAMIVAYCSTIFR